MLIGQALVEDLCVVTRDRLALVYGAKVLEA